MYSFPVNLLHLQRSDKSKSPDLDLATGIANMAGLVRCRLLRWDQQIRCCHAVSGTDTFTDHNKLSSFGTYIDPVSKSVCQTGSTTMFSIQSVIPICMYFIYNVAVILVPERLNVFYIAVNCEWAQVGVCVGVVELPAGLGSSTDKIFTHRLSIPELGSTRNPLISTSHLPSSTEEGDRGRQSGVREPLEFMIMK